MSQAYAEDRSLSCQLANAVVRIGDRLRISGAIRQENSVRLKCKNIFRARFCRHDSDVATLVHEHAQDVLLDAVVVSNYVQRALGIEFLDWLPSIGHDWTLVPRVTLFSTNYACEISAIHFGNGTSLGHELLGIRFNQRYNAAHDAMRA